MAILSNNEPLWSSLSSIDSQDTFIGPSFSSISDGKLMREAYHVNLSFGNSGECTPTFTWITSSMRSAVVYPLAFCHCPMKSYALMSHRRDY
ncbi:hypothetical protein PM082_016750 [Marasmius tenuissimus]|nr:hypothetical protein PM082_016750 [Marasmius tenuissimus]